MEKQQRNSSSPPATSTEGGREDQDQDLLCPPQRPLECPLLLCRGAQPQGSSAGGTVMPRRQSLRGGGALRSSALLRSSTLPPPTRPNASYPACRCPTPCSRTSPTSPPSSTPATSGTTSCRGRPRPRTSGPAYSVAAPGEHSSLCAICRFLGSDNRETFFKTTQRHQVVSSQPADLCESLVQPGTSRTSENSPLRNLEERLLSGLSAFRNLVLLFSPSLLPLLLLGVLSLCCYVSLLLSVPSPPQHVQSEAT